MPIHKLCFLTLASYREDEDICVDDLIKHWKANAFVKPNAGQSIEEVARDYLNDLVGRNMIEFDDMGNVLVHDLLLNLCREKASIANVHVVGFSDFYITLARCVGSHFTGYGGRVPIQCCGRIFHQLHSIVTASPQKSAYFCFKCNKVELREHFCSQMMHHNFSSSTISVCEEKVPHFHGVADEVVRFESLKHSNYHFRGNALWNVLEHAHNTQPSYHMMPQLKFSGFVPVSNERIVFEQLIVSDEYFYSPLVFPCWIFCSHSLKRLCIFSANIRESDIRALKDLANLEQLVFKKCSFDIFECHGNPSGFCSLKYLGISNSDLGTLTVRHFDFPRLVRLWLNNLTNFWNLSFCDDISGIVSPFQSLRLDGNFKGSVVESGKKILRKKWRLGVEHFYVTVNGSLLRLDEESPRLKSSDAKEEEEREFALFEMMMMSIATRREYIDVKEYQSILHKAQQQEHLFIFGPDGRDIVKRNAITASMFPNLKVITNWEWDGYPLIPSLKKLQLDSI